MNLILNNNANIDEQAILNNSWTFIVTENKRTQIVLPAWASWVDLDFCGMTVPTYVKIVCDTPINLTMWGNTINNTTLFECMWEISQITVSNSSGADDSNITMILAK